MKLRANFPYKKDSYELNQRDYKILRRMVKLKIRLRLSNEEICQRLNADSKGRKLKLWRPDEILEVLTDPRHIDDTFERLISLWEHRRIKEILKNE